MFGMFRRKRRPEASVRSDARVKRTATITKVERLEGGDWGQEFAVELYGGGAARVTHGQAYEQPCVGDQFVEYADGRTGYIPQHEFRALVMACS